MSSTNKTTYYNLSQYIGTDKPTYLGDYNSDMSKIDGAIHTVEEKATNATQDAGNASARVTALEEKTNTNTKNIGSLTTQVNTMSDNLSVTAQNANTALSKAETADTKADSALSNANTANTTANQALTTAQQVQTNLNSKLMRSILNTQSGTDYTHTISVTESINNFDMLLFDTPYGVLKAFKLAGNWKCDNNAWWEDGFNVIELKIDNITNNGGTFVASTGRWISTSANTGVKINGVYGIKF